MADRLAWSVRIAITVALAAWLVPEPARAYCRSTASGGSQECGPCPDGTPLFWPAAPIVVTPHEYVPGESRALTSARLPPIDRVAFHDAIERATRAWTDAPCEGGRPSLFAGVTRRTGSGLHMDDGENVIAIAPDLDTWLMQEKAEPAVFAVTYVSYYARTGEFVEADMVFNPNHGCEVEDCAGSEPALCDDTGCESGTYDLDSVLAHEMGHFFGMGHAEPGGDVLATMFCMASPFETHKRSLADDDITGICDAYPPGERLPGAGFSGGCSTAPTNAPLLAVTFLVLLGRSLPRRSHGAARGDEEAPRHDPPSGSAGGCRRRPGRGRHRRTK